MGAATVQRKAWFLHWHKLLECTVTLAEKGYIYIRQSLAKSGNLGGHTEHNSSILIARLRVQTPRYHTLAELQAEPRKQAVVCHDPSPEKQFNVMGATTVQRKAWFLHWHKLLECTLTLAEKGYVYVR